MTIRWRIARAAALSLPLMVIAPWHLANAQTATNSAAAQALFDDARKLMAGGQLREACPKFEESQRLDPGSGTLMNLAVCYERQGRTASAWTTYIEAANASRLAGKSDRARIAQEKAAAIAPKLARITIHVASDNTSSLEVQRDGVMVRPAMWETAIPLDPGPHSITATAPGRKSWQTTVAARESVSETVTIPELPAAKAEPKETSMVAAANAHSGNSAPLETTEPSSYGSSQRIWALTAGGLGVAGLAVGTIFGLQSKAAHDEWAEKCSSSGCPREPSAGFDAGARAIRTGNISTAAFIVGGVGLAAGSVLWLTAPNSKTQVGTGVGSVELRGQW